MVSKLRSWWQNTSKPRLVLIITLLVILLVLLIGGYFFNWTWTGFGPYTPPTSDFQRGVTLYDWLQLFFIPAAIAFGVWWLNRLQQQRDQQLAKTEREAAEKQAQAERKAAEKRAQVEREAAERQAQTERDVALDNQREAALQDYIDSMSELLLEKHLREIISQFSQYENVRQIARVRTLTVLPRLDGRRKAIVLKFLYESGLIDKDKTIIYLSGADLSDADLAGTDLTTADLTGAFLTRANLFFAILQGARLVGANLSGANLVDALLSGADLSEANLSNATGITFEELEKQADSLKGATMPDGSKHD